MKGKRTHPLPEGIPVGTPLSLRNRGGLGVSCLLPYCIREGLGMGKKKLRQSRPRGKNFHTLLRAAAHGCLYEIVKRSKIKK